MRPLLGYDDPAQPGQRPDQFRPVTRGIGGMALTVGNRSDSNGSNDRATSLAIDVLDIRGLRGDECMICTAVASDARVILSAGKAPGFPAGARTVCPARCEGDPQRVLAGQRGGSAPSRPATAAVRQAGLGSCSGSASARRPGANVAYGSAPGPLGAVISAWPAVALIGSVEMVILPLGHAAAPRSPRACGLPRHRQHTASTPGAGMVTFAGQAFRYRQRQTRRRR